MSNDPLHLVFAGGGTGGHLFPGLAAAERLVGWVPGARITFAGSGKQFERREVAAAGFEYVALPCRPLPAGARDVFRFLVENLAGYLAAGRLLDEQGVAAAIGLGGYASVPVARAAGRHGLPLVLLEQNAVPGRATRWLARYATLVCAGLAQTRANLRCRCPVRVTGTPIRNGFAGRSRGESSVTEAPAGGKREADSGRQKAASPFRFPLSALTCDCPESEKRKAGSPLPRPRPPFEADTPLAHLGPPQRRLLVLGGSNGARSINQSVPRALYKLGADLAGWEIVHQSGRTELDATRQLYRKLGLEATVAGFIDRMPEVLAASDLAVCRAGGTTLAELAAAGLPAVLLPLPRATDDHQRRNAEVFTKSGGSITVDECRLPGRLDDHLAETIRKLLRDPHQRARMAVAMRRLARPNAAAEVAALILEEVRRRSPRSLPAAA
jgi:UDP-N-acetylglucosamine--N-acetylmuramyl-(pentapeptide) pyrophosphoryl-undecaprenol N-acetylglucosamine transferase